MTTTPQVRFDALYRNSGAHSSGKTGKKSLTLAAEIARSVGMVRTWPNVQTIRLAIESEAEDRGIAIERAAALISHAAAEITPFPLYTPASDWNVRQIQRLNDIDRFWFEDARWRAKASYWKLIDALGETA